MRWKERRKSSNVDDRRGRSRMSSGRGGANISPGMVSLISRFIFSKTGLIVIAFFLIFSWITGINPLHLIQQSVSPEASNSAINSSYVATPEQENLADFSAVVLADTEDVWRQLIENYREPILVLFAGSVESACGNASAAVGPFYCSGDEKLYIDLSFYQDLKDRFNAPGDFAQAYVIAHEVGHHIQHLMGITEGVHKKRGQISEEAYNKLSVRLELQADFLAGVWAHHAQRINNILEPGDIDEALNAASAIGDDRLQMQSRGYVVSDSFTHGTSEQRMRWFKKGFETGDLSQGDTFTAIDL